MEHKSTTLTGTGFLNSVTHDVPDLRRSSRTDFQKVHAIVSDYCRALSEQGDRERIRACTIETLNRLLPCEQVHLFFAADESVEQEIVEAFGTEGIRIKNRFASDQLMVISVRGGMAGGASAVIRLVNKLDWTAFTEEDALILQSLIAPLSLRLDTLRLERGLKSQIQSSILALASTIEAKDRYTGGHTKRVYGYAEAISAELPIPEAEQERIRLAGLLHDIGKIGVPDRILQKPTELTEGEWQEMRQHTESGYEIVSRVNGLEDVAEILRHHHERWDGTGYPRGLREEQIPRAARIIAVADTFDAMVTERPYRKAIHPDVAREIIVRLAGTQFDPWVIEGFDRAFPKLRALALGE